MRKFAVGLVGMCMLLCLGGASVATASKRVRLTSLGFYPTQTEPTVLPVGTETVLVGAFFGESGSSELSCRIQVAGAILSTEKPTDQIALTHPTEGECETPGYTVSTGTWSVSLKASGKATFISETPTEIAQPGPCVYGFSKFAVTLELPGFVNTGFADVTGKLDRRASLGGCAKKRTFLYVLNVDATEPGDFNGGELEAEVVR